jgi:hypothetical protein
VTSVLLVGAGAVGARAARQLASTEGVERLLIREVEPERAAAVCASLGSVATIDGAPAAADAAVDVVLLCGPRGTHVDVAAEHLRRGAAVVSCSDDLADVTGLLDLGAEARERNRPVVVGAAFSPGLSCLLAAHGAETFDAVEEIHVARLGTGGPACARQHHRALGRRVLEWQDHGWRHRPPGSGRELCWFPDPIGAADCYRAELADPVLLTRAFRGASRVSARLAATRRDRLTGRLPMLRPPHPEGAAGAIRVEVRGRRGRASETLVLGAIDRPAVAAGAVAALAALAVARGEVRNVDAGGLAELVEPLPFLLELARRGVRAATFEGTEPSLQ